MAEYEKTPQDPQFPQYDSSNQTPGYGYQNNYPNQGYANAQAPGYYAGYTQQKSRVAAGILGILLGAFGIHNFYLGKTSLGLIQLLVSVLSFGLLAWAMGIWGFIEGILILVRSGNYQFDGRGIPLGD